MKSRILLLLMVSLIGCSTMVRKTTLGIVDDGVKGYMNHAIYVANPALFILSDLCCWWEAAENKHLGWDPDDPTDSINIRYTYAAITGDRSERNVNDPPEVLTAEEAQRLYAYRKECAIFRHHERENSK